MLHHPYRETGHGIYLHSRDGEQKRTCIPLHTISWMLDAFRSEKVASNEGWCEGWCRPGFFFTVTVEMQNLETGDFERGNRNYPYVSFFQGLAQTKLQFSSKESEFFPLSKRHLSLKKHLSNINFQTEIADFGSTYHTTTTFACSNWLLSVMATTLQKFENAERYLSLFNELKGDDACNVSLAHFKAMSLQQPCNPTAWIDQWHDRYHTMIKTLGTDIDNVL